MGAVLAVVTALRASGSDTLYSTVFLTLGGLHLWYDAFIWKLRRPAVGRAFHIPAPVSVGS